MDGNDGDMGFLSKRVLFMLLYSLLSIDFNRAYYDREILFILNDFFMSIKDGYFFFFSNVALLWMNFAPYFI